MGFRSLVLLSIVATTLSLARPARAGTGGSTSSAPGVGGSTGDPSCTAAYQSTAGTTCQACATSACSSLGSDYSFACQSSSTEQVWCNGPARTQPSDQNVACAVSAPGDPASGVASGIAAGSALALAIALGARRRRRPQA